MSGMRVGIGATGGGFLHRGGRLGDARLEFLCGANRLFLDRAGDVATQLGDVFGEVGRGVGHLLHGVAFGLGGFPHCGGEEADGERDATGREGAASVCWASDSGASRR